MQKQPKYVFVTGGVASGLGKGITTASLGRLFRSRGLRVALQKLDEKGQEVGFTFYSFYENGPVALGWLRASHRALDRVGARHRHAGVVHDINRDEIRARRGAGVAVRASGGDACDEGAVAVAQLGGDLGGDADLDLVGVGELLTVGETRARVHDHGPHAQLAGEPDDGLGDVTRAEHDQCGARAVHLEERGPRLEARQVSDEIPILVGQ